MDVLTNTLVSATSSRCIPRDLLMGVLDVSHIHKLCSFLLIYYINQDRLLGWDCHTRIEVFQERSTLTTFYLAILSEDITIDNVRGQ
jgi:hypothetical protein